MHITPSLIARIARFSADFHAARMSAAAALPGNPFGMASFSIAGGAGFCGTAGVAPEYRNRGVQRALIQRRIADAADLGCDLILGGSSPGTTEFRNFERAGLRLVPTGSVWKEIRAVEK